MADLRVFTNPFTKNESRVKRNTRDSRWAPVNHTHSFVQKQPGPSKTYHLVNQQSSYVSQLPVVSMDPDGSESNISDSQDVSPKKQNHFPPLTRTRQISPTSSSYLSRRDSLVSAIGPVDLSLFREERNDSSATVFPSYPIAIKKPESQPKRGLVDLFHSIKLIYDIGPDGEGQKVWKGYREFRKEKQKQAVGRQKRLALSKNRKPRTIPRSDALGLTAHPAAAPLAVVSSLRPLPAQSQKRSKSRDIESSDGKISMSSRDIPIGIDNDAFQFIDVNKPLPPIPQLQPPPKTRRAVGGANRHMVGIAAAGIQFPPQWKGGDQHGEDEGSRPANWGKTRADKQTAKAHQALKAKISRPSPLATLSEGQSVNVASECGGVGGPAAARSIPVGHNGIPLMQTHHIKRKDIKQPPPLNLDILKERAKGKQKAKVGAPTVHWRDMFDTIAHPTGKAVRRRSSESSFGCQGLPDGTATAFVQGAGPSMQFQTRKTHVDDEAMVPKPLFSNTCGASEGVRDTRFYQAYRGVLDEY